MSLALGIEANTTIFSLINSSLLAVGASWGFPSNLGSAEDGAPAERVQGTRFTASMWDVLGVRPIRGRVFTPEEDRNGSPAPVAVISYSFWHAASVAIRRSSARQCASTASRPTSSA